MDYRRSSWPVKLAVPVLLAVAASAMPSAIRGDRQIHGSDHVEEGSPNQPVDAAATSIWRPAQAEALLAYINGIGREGLASAYYDPEGLAAALRSGDAAVLDKIATDRFNRLSSDLALGHVRGKARGQWHIADDEFARGSQEEFLKAALRDNRVAEALDGLLPVHPQYAALRSALASPSTLDPQIADRVRLNMERWRWLPRELGNKYVIVNVPAFYATLVDNGQVRWKDRAVAGALKTPTPQISAVAKGVIINPWWEVPPSLAKEVRGKAGFVSVRDAAGRAVRWRQPPGPANALGRMKFVMPNDQSIYLHDTNARSRFNSSVRAFSHGCIRTRRIDALAAELGSDDGGQWTAARISAALAAGKTVEATFSRPVPVFIVYFSVAALNDGSIISYEDLYHRDSKVLAGLGAGQGRS